MWPVLFPCIRMVQAKYVGRAYVAPLPARVLTGPGDTAQQLGILLWQAVEASDARAALQVSCLQYNPRNAVGVF